MQRLEREELWRSRREEQREWEWGMADKLKKRIEEMLRFPLAEITRDEDGAVTVVKPVRWRQGDIPQFGKAATELSRLAAVLETERKTLEVSGAIEHGYDIIEIIVHDDSDSNKAPVPAADNDRTEP
jgi:hypothetical protein